MWARHKEHGLSGRGNCLLLHLQLSSVLFVALSLSRPLKVSATNNYTRRAEQFGPEWNISTTRGCIAVTFCTDIHCPPEAETLWLWWSPDLSYIVSRSKFWFVPLYLGFMTKYLKMVNILSLLLSGSLPVSKQLIEILLSCILQPHLTQPIPPTSGETTLCAA